MDDATPGIGVPGSATGDWGTGAQEGTARPGGGAERRAEPTRGSPATTSSTTRSSSAHWRPYPAAATRARQRRSKASGLPTELRAKPAQAAAHPEKDVLADVGGRKPGPGRASEAAQSADMAARRPGEAAPKRPQRAHHRANAVPAAPAGRTSRACKPAAQRGAGQRQERQC